VSNQHYDDQKEKREKETKTRDFLNLRGIEEDGRGEESNFVAERKKDENNKKNKKKKRKKKKEKKKRINKRFLK
jgi:hypothetical protein